jgi:hypothetical protein
MLYNLDNVCGRRLRFRDLIECGSTFEGHSDRYNLGLEGAPLLNLPKLAATWSGLSALATYILDPAEAQFGAVRVTYGFAGPALVRAIRKRARAEGRSPRIHPPVDQHAGEEMLDGARICDRPGVAVDFEVPGVSSATIAAWLLKNAPIDRLYLYGEHQPLHVSWAPQPNGLAYRMTGAHRTPQRWVDK